jgi:cysteine desulfurase
MKGERIYLDHAATTPVDPRVTAAMLECLAGEAAFGNAASATHDFGREAAARIHAARGSVAALIGARPEEIVFTSGATESNNLALFGIMRANGDRGRHLVTSRTEHRAVLDPVHELARSGFEVTWLTPDSEGALDPAAIGAALRPDTLLVSIMDVNNEIGARVDLRTIGQLCRERGVLLHTDAAQSVGREPFDVRELGVDLAAFSAHKFYGPKGIGALWVSERARPWLKPILFGGGQERGLRSGTLATHQIVGFGVACDLARSALHADAPRVTVLRERLWEGLARLGGVYRNGRAENAASGILNVSVEGVEGESLIAALGPLAVARGSACASETAEPSYVLRALGRRPALAQSSLRFGLGRGTTEAEIDRALALVGQAVERLRAVASAPLAGAASAAAHRPHTPQAPPGGSDFDPLAPATRALFETLPGAGRLSPTGRAGALVVGCAGSESDGAEVRFYLEVAEDSVKEARFEAWGCPHTLAVASWITGQLPGRARGSLVPGEPEAWRARLGVPFEKLGRLLVIEDALRDCVQRWPLSAVT